jgi:hypothetical protein
MKRAILAVAAVALVACADQRLPTELAEADAPLFAKGGQGQGAQFVDNPFTGISHGDGEGNTCLALDNTGGSVKDFIRTNPDGTQWLYFNRHSVDITVTTPNGVYTGTGKLTAHINFSTFDPWNSSVTGKVSDGTDTKQAVCKYTSTPSGKVTQSRVVLN